MERSDMEGIAERLSAIDDLYFPGHLRSQPLDASHRRSALFDLLSRDASIFLERYGGELSSDELEAFNVLRSNYEVGWYVDHFRRRLIPTEADSRAKSAIVRNRRRAYMDRLTRDGEYFSEDSMREREPYLHHQYLGRFQNQAGRVLFRPGEKFSETLMRLCDEAMLVEKIRCEQQRLGVARNDWVGSSEDVKEEQEEKEQEESEEEESEEEVNELNVSSNSFKAPVDDTSANVSSARGSERALSTEEMQDQLDQFTYAMQQKFLSGEDSAHLDYSAIDNDEALDDHWIREANYDAEEKYFDED